MDTAAATSKYRKCPHCGQRQQHFGTAWVHSAIPGRRLRRDVSAACALIRSKRAAIAQARGGEKVQG